MVAPYLLTANPAVSNISNDSGILLFYGSHVIQSWCLQRELDIADSALQCLLSAIYCLRS